MKVPASLKKLANLFPVPLYVVGGAVRDELLGYPPKDYDIASELPTDAVIALCRENGIAAVTINRRLGTLRLKADGDSYEYTTFRTDCYAGDGSHLPIGVRFTREMMEDALRRDFTVNAIYYDVKADRYVDLTGGRVDLQTRLIRATRAPESVIAEDALRILRMVRFAVSLDFEMEIGLYEAAKKLSPSLASISPERIREEFDKILIADTFYGVKGAHIRGLRLLVAIGAMEYVVPELLEGIGVEQRPDYHKYDVFGHILKTVELSPPAIRLAAVMHDIAKPRLKAETGTMAGHAEAGGEFARRRMSHLCYSNAEISRVVKLVEGHMFDLKGDASEKTVRTYIQKNAKLLDDLIALKNADHLGGGRLSGKSPSAERLERTRQAMREEGVPFSVSELQVDGEDLIALDVPREKRGRLLEALLEETTVDRGLLTREGQLNYLKKHR